jgi:hypothetical protein
LKGTPYAAAGRDPLIEINAVLFLKKKKMFREKPDRTTKKAPPGETAGPWFLGEEG